MRKRVNLSDAWLDFLEEVEKAKEELGFDKNEECFYRGHSHIDHQLLPGIFRGLDNRVKEIPDDLWEIEYDMFYEFRARAKEVHQGNLTDWDILFYMQHHRCKTRLLDWTENFGVALYFALLGKYNQGFSPVIWMLNPYALNEKYHDVRDLYSPEFLDTEDGESYSDMLAAEAGFPWKEPIAIYPIRRVDRLTTQGGYFTVHGNDVRPIEQLVPARSNIWKKIVLPVDAIPDAQTFLDRAGIHDFTMFPDLDGLASYLNNKYFR